MLSRKLVLIFKALHYSQAEARTREAPIEATTCAEKYATNSFNQLAFSACSWGLSETLFSSN